MTAVDIADRIRALARIIEFTGQPREYTRAEWAKELYKLAEKLEES